MTSLTGLAGLRIQNLRPLKFRPSVHITSLQALRAIYNPARERALKKEIPSLDVHAVQFIGLSPFVVLASGGADAAHPSLDASPHGGEPGFVKVLDARALLTPDAPGNNRLDTLENIVSTGQLGLLFMVPGFDETLRDQIQAFKGETIEVEPQAVMLERYKQSL